LHRQLAGAFAPPICASILLLWHAALRRLRLHGLIEHWPNSFRYHLTDFGLGIALFFTPTYNRLLRPGLPAALPALRSVTTLLQRALNTLGRQIDAAVKQAKLATSNLIIYAKCRSNRQIKSCIGAALLAFFSNGCARNAASL
jgi:hypothetical protein